MKKQDEKPREKFFGIDVAKDDSIDYQNIIAQMFMCPNLTPEHAVHYIAMLENDELSVERLLETIDDEMFQTAIYNDNSNEVMYDKLKDWESKFGPMTDADKKYLHDMFGFKASDLKINKRAVSKEKNSPSILKKNNIFKSPKELSDLVKQEFKGQDDTINKLAVVFYMQYISRKYGIVNPLRSVLLIGKSGIGKSGICDCFERICDFPSTTVNSCHFSPTGYKDPGLSEIIANNIKCKGYTEEQMDYHVLHVEEVDKFARAGEYNSGMMEQIMQFDNRGNYIVCNNGIDLNNGTNQLRRLCTEKWLIILDGAFLGIEDIVRKRMNINKPFGFANNDNNDYNKIDVWKNVKPEDIVSYGFKEELVRRIGCICALNPLTKDTIYKILSEAKGNKLQEYVEFSKYVNIDLSFSNETRMLLAENASHDSFGMGSVNQSLFPIIQPIFYEKCDELNSENKQTIVIDKDFVTQQLKTR